MIVVTIPNVVEQTACQIQFQRFHVTVLFDVSVAVYSV